MVRSLTKNSLVVRTKHCLVVTLRLQGRFMRHLAIIYVLAGLFCLGYPIWEWLRSEAMQIQCDRIEANHVRCTVKRSSLRGLWPQPPETLNSVTGTSIQSCDDNSNRICLILRNDSTEVIVLKALNHEGERLDNIRSDITRFLNPDAVTLKLNYRPSPVESILRSPLLIFIPFLLGGAFFLESLIALGGYPGTLILDKKAQKAIVKRHFLIGFTTTTLQTYIQNIIAVEVGDEYLSDENQVWYKLVLLIKDSPTDKHRFRISNRPLSRNLANELAQEINTFLTESYMPNSE